MPDETHRETVSFVPTTGLRRVGEPVLLVTPDGGLYMSTMFEQVTRITYEGGCVPSPQSETQGNMLQQNTAYPLATGT